MEVLKNITPSFLWDKVRSICFHLRMWPSLKRFKDHEEALNYFYEQQREWTHITSSRFEITGHWQEDVVHRKESVLGLRIYDSRCFIFKYVKLEIKQVDKIYRVYCLRGSVDQRLYNFISIDGKRRFENVWFPE